MDTIKQALYCYCWDYLLHLKLQNNDLQNYSDRILHSLIAYHLLKKCWIDWFFNHLIQHEIIRTQLGTFTVESEHSISATVLLKQKCFYLVVSSLFDL